MYMAYNISMYIMYYIKNQKVRNKKKELRLIIKIEQITVRQFS